MEVCPGGATRLEVCLLMGVLTSQHNMTEVRIYSLHDFLFCHIIHLHGCVLVQAATLAIVEFLAAVLPAHSPSPTGVEVLKVTAGPAAEPVAASVNDCVLFRNAHPAHDPTGRRAALADLDACPVCLAPRYVKGTKRNRKTFWC